MASQFRILFAYVLQYAALLAPPVRLASEPC